MKSILCHFEVLQPFFIQNSLRSVAPLRRERQTNKQIKAISGAIFDMFAIYSLSPGISNFCRTFPFNTLCFKILQKDNIYTFD